MSRLSAQEIEDLLVENDTDDFSENFVREARNQNNRERRINELRRDLDRQRARKEKQEERKW